MVSGRAASKRTMLFVGLAMVCVSFGGGLQRALFVPSDVVAALHANPRAPTLVLEPVTQPQREAKLKAKAVTSSPVAPLSAPTETATQAVETGLPVGEPEEASPPFATGEQFASALPPASQDRAAKQFGPGVAPGIPSGADIYGGYPTEPLPEPEVWSMTALGLLISAWSIRRKRRAAAMAG